MLGLAGLVSPASLRSLVGGLWRRAWGPLAVMTIRIVLGIVLMLAAADSRFPLALGVLGAMSLIGAVAIPALGRERQRQVLAWWQRQRDTLLRAWSLAAFAAGAFVVHACW